MKLPGGVVSCYSCAVYFWPGEGCGREEEILCLRCRSGNPVELTDAFGLPRTVKAWTPRGGTE